MITYNASSLWDRSPKSAEYDWRHTVMPASDNQVAAREPSSDWG